MSVGKPKMRFPGFSDAWQDQKLGNITNHLTSGSRDWAQYYAETGSTFIRMTNLPRTGISLLMDDLKFVSVDKTNTEGSRTSLEPRDVLISITAELGKIGFVPENLGEAYINQHTALVRVKQDVAYPECVAHALSSPKLHNALNSLNDAGAKAGLNLSTLKAFILTLPSIDEQEKIAKSLSAVDEKVESLRRHHATLLRFKAGLTQKLFSQELRFQQDDGEDFPDWEEAVLPEVAQIRKGKQLSKADMKGGIYPVMNGSLDPVGWHDEPNREAGGIAMTEGGDCGQVRFMDAPYWSSGHSYDIRAKSEDQTRFLYFVLQHNKKVLQDMSTGGALKNLPISTLSELPVSIPCLEEQRKIAHALSTMDERINAVGKEIALMETFKKGLLQQMFV